LASVVNARNRCATKPPTIYSTAERPNVAKRFNQQTEWSIE
jgi:hypothetical protein